MIDETYDEDENICQIKDDMKSPFSKNQTFKNIRALRDEYKADLVGLIVSNRATTCGCGSLPSTSDWSADTSEKAYFVATVECATTYYSFTHEVGHAFVSVDIDGYLIKYFL